jgi:hypothetical protein
MTEHFIELLLFAERQPVLVAAGKILTVSSLKNGTYIAFEAGGGIKVVESYDDIKRLLWNVSQLKSSGALPPESP